MEKQVTKDLTDVLQTLQKLTSFSDHLSQENELVIKEEVFPYCCASQSDNQHG